MSEDRKFERRIFFTGILIGILTGTAGNFFVTSLFEVIIKLGWDENPSYFIILVCGCIGSFFLLLWSFWVAWNELKKS